LRLPRVLPSPGPRKDTNTTRLDASIARRGPGGRPAPCGLLARAVGSEDNNRGPPSKSKLSRREIALSQFSNSQTCARAVSATAAMSDNGDVNDFGDVEEPEPDVGEDPFGGSDLEPVTDDEEEDDDGEDLLENQEMCVIGPFVF